MENPDESASESIPQTSIMDSLGVEIVGVVAPVSATMLLVVFLLTSLYSSTTSTDSPPVSAATLIYTESPSDSTSQKFIGSVEDAVAFIVLIAIATFILVLLYYYNFTKFLKNYMRFSVFFTLATIGGSILASLLQRFSIPLDAITATILLLNFAILGVLSVFSTGMPILIKQSYMVAVSVIIAVWFARLPEWTTWTLLIALAIYDLVAVLSPHGPLRILVELAQSRDDELPALVYEARPNINPQIAITRPIAALGSVELQPVNQSSNSNSIEVEEREEERLPLVSSPQINPNSANQNPPITLIEQISESTESETSPLVSRERQRPPLPPPNPSQENQTENDFEFEFEMFDSTRGIRLGLGDFIFYSVLVGRAAMFDLMTVYACYLAIIAGLGCTLILLSVFRKALPALPISIFLGVVFYFLTRILMEPFVVGASTNLVMF